MKFAKWEICLQQKHSSKKYVATFRESFPFGKALGARPWLLHCREYANDISTKAKGIHSDEIEIGPI